MADNHTDAEHNLEERMKDLEKKRALNDGVNRLVVSMYALSIGVREPFEKIKSTLLEEATEERAKMIVKKRRNRGLPGGP